MAWFSKDRGAANVRKQLENHGYNTSHLSDSDLDALSRHWDAIVSESGRTLEKVISGSVGIALKLGKDIREATRGFEEMSRFSHKMRDSAKDFERRHGL